MPGQRPPEPAGATSLSRLLSCVADIDKSGLELTLPGEFQPGEVIVVERAGSVVNDRSAASGLDKTELSHPPASAVGLGPANCRSEAELDRRD